MEATPVTPIFAHGPAKDRYYTGFMFTGDRAQLTKDFFTVRCPCGVTDSRALNEFPMETTPHKCGNPNHFFVQWSTTK